MKTRPYPLRRTALTGLLAAAGASLPAAAQESGADQHHNLDEILVVATPLPRTVEELAQPTAVLTGDELARKASTSLGETVSKELGVSSSYFGPVSSRPVIRGQYGERVKVLTNQLDILDASALSEDHQTAVEGILADHIEIIRGPATLLYGSGASGGIVNVVDRRIPEQPLEDGVVGGVALGADTAVEERAGAGYVQFGNERVSAHLDYFRRDTDNIEIPGFAESARLRAAEEAEEGEEGEEEEEAFGTVENSDSQTDGGAAGVTLHGENGFIGVSVSFFDSEYGVPGGHEHAHEEEEGEEEEEEEEEIVRIDLEQTRVDLTGEYRFDGVIEKARLRFATNDYEHVELEGDEVGTLFESDGIDLRLELTQRATERLEGAFGVQYSDTDFNAVGEEAYVPPSETSKLSVFTFQEFRPNDSLALQGSARIEQQEITGSVLPTDYDETAFGASIGGIYSFSDDASIAANLSVTQRHPNATELYADGPHIAVQRFERGSETLGNGTLDKETSTNFDLTYRGNTQLFDWAVTGFINNVDDYIGLLPTDEEEDELQVFEYTQFDARFWGFEAETRIELMDSDAGHLHTRLFADYVFAEQDGGTGDYLPRIPPLRYGLGFHDPRDKFEFSADARFVTKQDKVAENELPTDSYTLVGAEVSYAMEEQGIYVFLRGSNLTDEDARQHTSPLKDTVPLPGRSLHAGFRWSFGG